ncbi:MAG: TROVE domain-containing protein [Metallibacterium sp.]
MFNYSNVLEVPQSEAILGREKEMIKNDAKGYVFSISPLQMLKRFLILGSTSGTYYVSSKELTTRNISNIIDIFKTHGKEAIDLIIETSIKAPKNSPSLIALALALTHGDIETKKYGYDKISFICRTSSHLFEFIQYIQELRGWSRGLRNGVAKFYNNKDYEQLAYQFIKYRQREGWTHRDILRLAHPKSNDDKINNLFKWSVGKLENPEEEYIRDFLQLQDTKDVKTAIDLIIKHNFTWETVPTELLKSVKIWESLLPAMPLTAMTRNLGRLASLGMLNPFSNNTNLVCKKLSDRDIIVKSRIHPYQLALSLFMYNNEQGFKGDLTWKSNQQIKDALNNAFMLAFGNVKPTNKNIVLAIDVSGSMTEQIYNSALSALDGAAVMALITRQVEPNVEIIAFNTRPITDFSISKSDSLLSVLDKIHRINEGGTDCSIPMKVCNIDKVSGVDSFIIYTDNETWAGKTHPYNEFKKYQSDYNKNCKMINVAMTATKGSITANESDMLEVIGFDVTAPAVISEFIQEGF